VVAFRPPMCVMENVPGMLSIEGRDITGPILQNFAAAGYRTTVALVNAVSFGVPQERRRLIFIGVRRDLGLRIEASGLTTFAEHFRHAVLGLHSHTTLRQAIGDLPNIEHGEREETQPYSRPPGRQGKYVELMRQGSNGMVLDHVCRGHNAQDLRAFRFMKQGMLYHHLPQRFKRYRDDIFKDKYKKLIWDRPACTVTAHFAKDVYTHIHPDQARTVSVREAARLQSFPDSFLFAGHMGERFRQIGNAVPPLMGWGIAEYIRGSLEEWSCTTN
jgi:DNA (cytosine-5)-methyltransferase 1